MFDVQPSSSDARFIGSIPELYDRYLGPLLFVDYAIDLASRVRLGPAEHAAVLEIAAGTGILTEQLRARLPADVALTATDLNAPMLAVAEQRLAAAGLGDGITWRTADATELPFPDASFDAVVCEFGVMFFPDKPRAALETRRVLRPGGQWLFSVWGSHADNEFARIAHETISGFFTERPPGFYRVPFGFSDATALRSLVIDAGFAEPEIVTLDRVAVASSAADAAIGLVLGNPVVDEIRQRGIADPHDVATAVERALVKRYGDRPLRFPTRIRVVATHAP